MRARESQLIATASITASAETQVRVQMDLMVSAQYRVAMDEGSVFPPIDVFWDGTTHWLADGFHRLHAARERGDAKIRAVVHQGTKRDAILFAVGANVTHGRARTNEDKRHAVEMVLADPGWRKKSDPWVAKACGVAPSFVFKVRSLLSERSDTSRQFHTRWGTVAEMDTTRIGKSGKLVPEVRYALLDSVVADDTHNVQRIAGMDPEQQVAIAEAAVSHPEQQTVQKLWATVNRQEIARRVANLPEFGDRWQVHHCAALDLIERLPAKSVDVIITDPPYPEEYLSVYADLSRLGAHVLKDGGLCVVMVGKQHLPAYMAGLATALDYHWLAPIILTETARVWDRRIFTSWKPLLVYSRGKYAGPMFNDVIQGGTPPEKTLHEWEQDETLMSLIVQRFSQPASVVLDPFCGAGTTGVSSLKHARIFIGADLDQHAAETSRLRLSQTCEAA